MDIETVITKTKAEKQREYVKKNYYMRKQCFRDLISIII